MKVMINVDIDVSVELDKPTGLYVSKCPMFNLISQGTTENEAYHAIQSTIKLYLETCNKRQISFEAISK